MEENLNFGEALEAVKLGKMITRTGWNGKDLFVFKQVPASIPKDVVPKMQSLPESVKNEFQKRFDSGNLDFIYYTDQLALVGPNNFISSWAPSVSDSLAEDWCILQ